jgi:hypothetical protein
MRQASLVVLIFAALMCVSLAQAQVLSVETIMQGGVGVADPEISSAWLLNPAGLARAAATGEDGARTSDLALGYGTQGESDIYYLTWGGGLKDGDFGLGAGVFDQSVGNLAGSGLDIDFSYLGIGYGRGMGDKDMAWGVSVVRINLELGYAGEELSGNEVTFDAGLTGTLPGSMPMRYGLVMRDVTDEIARTWDIGVSVKPKETLTVGLDVKDLTDETDMRWQIGARQVLGKDGKWQVGAGLNDGDLSLGAIYAPGTEWQGAKWRYGLAWQDTDGDSALILGVTGAWGK